MVPYYHQRAHGLRKGDEHPAYTPVGVWHTLPLVNTWQLINYINVCYYAFVKCGKYYRSVNVVIAVQNGPCTLQLGQNER